MPDTTETAHMGLGLPNVSSAPGPQWATDVNQALIQVDQHNHSPGQGVPVVSTGININSDLPFGSNNATALRSVRFVSSTATSGTDTRSLSAGGDDLFYRDGQGRRIRLTQDGGIVAASGNITGLAAPAQLEWVPGTATFVFTSSATVAANIDGRSHLVRNAAPGANAVTIAATSATNAWTMTLPTSAPLIGQSLTAADGVGALQWRYPGRFTAEQTANYTATGDETVITCNAASSAFRVDLPTAASVSGKRYLIKRTDSNVLNVVTVDPSGSETIDGSTGTTLNTQYEGLEIVSDGSNWHTIQRFIPNQWATTLTFSASTGFGTLSSTAYQWRREGDSIRARGFFDAGTVAATSAFINLPAGIVLDTTDVASGTNRWAVGSLFNSGAGGGDGIFTVTAGRVLYVDTANTDRVLVSRFNALDASGDIFQSANVSAMMNTGAQVFFDFLLPVSGWKG